MNNVHRSFSVCQKSVKLGCSGCLLCAKGGAERRRGGGVVAEKLTNSHWFSADSKHLAVQSLSQPSAQVAIIDCSPLWLKTCHRHVFLTRRALYTREPWVQSQNIGFLTVSETPMSTSSSEFLSVHAIHMGRPAEMDAVYTICSYFLLKTWRQQS